MSVFEFIFHPSGLFSQKESLFGPLCLDKKLMFVHKFTNLAAMQF